MNAWITIGPKLVVLPNQLCISKEIFDHYLHSLRTIEKEIFDELRCVAHRRAHSLSERAVSYLRREKMVDERDQIPYTVSEMIKVWGCPVVFSFAETPIVKFISPPLEVIAKKDSPPPIHILPSTDEKKIAKTAPKSDKKKDLECQPSSVELQKILSEIKKDKKALQDFINKGGLEWNLGEKPYLFSLSAKTTKEFLCIEALRDEDLEILERILPFLNQEEMRQILQAAWNSNFLNPKTGSMLLQSYPERRLFLLNELFPEFLRNFSVDKSREWVKEMLWEGDWEAIQKHVIPSHLLEPLLIWRMRDQKYESWCCRVLKSKYKKFLNGARILEALSLLPPSVYRSQMALKITVCLDIPHHDSLKKKIFSLRAPDPSDGTIRIKIDQDVDSYLEKACLKKDFEAVKAIRDNFAFLLVNQRGLVYFKIHLNPQKIREASLSLRNLIG